MVLAVLEAETIVNTKTEATRIKEALEVVTIITKVLVVTVEVMVVSVVVVVLTILVSTTI